VKTLHGRHHDWAIKGDYVLERKRGRILLIRRVEKCNDCTRIKTQTIDIITGERVGAPYYSGDVIPYEDRMSDEQERVRWIAETSPDIEIRTQLSKG